MPREKCSALRPTRRLLQWLPCFLSIVNGGVPVTVLYLLVTALYLLATVQYLLATLPYLLAAVLYLLATVLYLLVTVIVPSCYRTSMRYLLVTVPQCDTFLLLCTVLYLLINGGSSGDRPRLHLRDLRVHHRQTAPAEAQHGVHLFAGAETTSIQQYVSYISPLPATLAAVVVMMVS